MHLKIFGLLAKCIRKLKFLLKFKHPYNNLTIYNVIQTFHFKYFIIITIYFRRYKKIFFLPVCIIFIFILFIKIIIFLIKIIIIIVRIIIIIIRIIIIVRIIRIIIIINIIFIFN